MTTENIKPVLAELDPIHMRISNSDHESINARWEFGRIMRKHIPEGKKNLPPGLRSEITKKYNLEASEITRRMQLAEKFTTERQVEHASTKCGGSWRRLIREELTKSREGQGGKQTPWADTKKATLSRWLTEVNGDDARHRDLAEMITDTARALGLVVTNADADAGPVAA